MKVGDDEPFKASKALTIVPAKVVTEYEIGYGKPPERTRFKPGRSGNPAGRPKGARNKSVNRTQERFKDIILEEAYRGVKINDGNRQVSIPMAQAVVRSLAVNAAKGNTRAQRLFSEMLAGTEATNRRHYEQLFDAALDYKLQWERELERRRQLSLDLPPPIPHPDHVKLDFQKGTVWFAGPMTKEEKAERELWLSHRPEFEAELKFLERDLRKAKDPARRKTLEIEIRQTRIVLDALDKIEASQSVFEK
jgi:hypothetical protein